MKAYETLSGWASWPPRPPGKKREKVFIIRFDVIKEINRVSKPGRRIYAKASSIPRIKNGLGLAIVSTSKGIMTDNEARNNKIGGEIICKVF